MIPVDFSRGMEIYPDLAEQLKDLDVGILGENDRLHAMLCIMGWPIMVIILLYTAHNIVMVT